MNGTINRALLLLSLLICFTVPVSAALAPIDENGDTAIDTETGEIYVWNYEEGHYELADNGSDSPVGEYNVVIVDNTADGDSGAVDSESPSAPVTLSDESVEQIAETIADFNASEGYNLGTTYTSIFAGVAYKVPFGQHYVYWRDGQYSYKFAYGDISLEGDEFVGNGHVTICSYDTSTAGYNSVYHWTTGVDSNFALSANDALVYSDLGSYPDIFNRRGLFNETAVMYGFACFLLWKLLSNVRKGAFGR